MQNFVTVSKIWITALLYVAAIFLRSEEVLAQGNGRPAPEVRLLNISPSAEDVRGRFPQAPGGVALFYFRGVKGTTYQATFGLPAILQSL